MRRTLDINSHSESRGYDKWMLLVVVLLLLIGLTAVYSSTSVVSPQTIETLQKKGILTSQFSFVKKQLFTVFLGVFVMLIAFKANLKLIKKAAVPLLLLSFVCLILVFTPLGVSGGGARRWIRAWPSTFQPSELVKLAMVIFLAWYMSRPGYITRESLSGKRFSKPELFSFLLPIFIMGIFQFVFIKQPDFGAVMSLGIITMAMLFLSGTRLRYLFSLSLLSVPFIAWMITEPYRWKRVTAFLDPWKDPLGSGFQLIQSFIALGSGGMTGVGLGESRQKLSFLPEVHTDFIFSLIGEELGFAGALFVVFLFFMLFLRGILVARKSKDLFPYYLAFGLSLMIAIQSIINFAVVTGLVPTKGLPLPFISYGGSSLIVSMTAIGLLLNISRSQTHFSETYEHEDIEKDAALHTRNPLSYKPRGFRYRDYRRIRGNISRA